jgi:hypothetical protein
MGYILFPGGYCSAVCTSDPECGPLGDCVNVMDLGRYCLRRCTWTSEECRTAEGYECSLLVGGPDQPYCVPHLSYGEDY